MKAASALSGVSDHTMRAWERRYGAIRPQRSPSGQRLYSEEEVERLRLLGRLTSQGHAIRQIAGLSTAELGALTQAAGEVLPPTRPEQPAGDFLHQATHALHNFNMERLGKVMAAAHAALGGRAFVLDVVSPLLTLVGSEVTAGRLSIAQEHLLSALLRDHLSPLYQALQVPQGGRHHLAFATTPGDLHEFGILLGAILAGIHGLRTSYLGPNLPGEEMVRAARSLGVTHLVVGVVPLPARYREQPLEVFFAALRRQLPASVAHWVGGAVGEGETIPPSSGVHVANLASFDNAVRDLSRNTTR